MISSFFGHSARLIAIALLASLPAALMFAQEPAVRDVLQQGAMEGTEQKDSDDLPQAPVDEFSRGTPRSSFIGFTRAARIGDFEKAAAYLDLRNLSAPARGMDAETLARRLKIVLDRAVWIDLHSLSQEPRGFADDGLPSYRDNLGQIEVDGQRFDLWLQRVPRGDGVQIWKISNATVGRVPELYELYGYGVIGEKLVTLMPEWELLGLHIVQWLMLIALLGVAYLIVSIPAWVIAWMVRRRGLATDSGLARFVTGPMRLFVAILLTRAFIDLIHPSVTARAWLEGYTVLLIVSVWLLIRLVDVLRVHWMNRLVAREDESRTLVFMRPAANLAKVVIILIAAMIWFENLGFKATTLIAGLGVGGLAVALATQKSIENLIGGITLFSSAPVRVGDFCRFGDTIGTVEEIGLRATKVRTLDRSMVHVPNAAFADMQLENYTERERIWYHPTLRLRYDTNPEQVRTVLVEIRRMLSAHRRVSAAPCRVNFGGYGESSLNINVFAYVETTDWADFVAVAEDLNLRIMDIIADAGTSFAIPMQAVSLERGP